MNGTLPAAAGSGSPLRGSARRPPTRSGRRAIGPSMAMLGCGFIRTGPFRMRRPALEALLPLRTRRRRRSPRRCPAPCPRRRVLRRPRRRRLRWSSMKHRQLRWWKRFMPPPGRIMSGLAAPGLGMAAGFGLRGIMPCRLTTARLGSAEVGLRAVAGLFGLADGGGRRLSGDSSNGPFRWSATSVARWAQPRSGPNNQCAQPDLVTKRIVIGSRRYDTVYPSQPNGSPVTNP